jgi:hypothetical protein
MARTMSVFKGSTGLNTKVDPVRLPYDPRTGVQDLAVAYNVVHDDTGRVSRRKGFTATTRTEDIHSLFCDGGFCLFVTGNALCRLNADYTYASLRNVTTGARMRCVQVAGKIYYANGHETGVVKEAGTSWSWVKGDYVGPATTRQYSNPPIGTILAYYNGRIYVVQGKTVWYSEPFAYGAFDLARNHFDFDENVTMFRPVAEGFWVGTEKNTLFLVGGTPQEFRRVVTAGYGVIEGTDDRIDLGKLGSGEMAGIGAIWTSNEGICVGAPGGHFSNLTEDKIDLWPDITARFGAGLCMNDNYISLLEP